LTNANVSGTKVVGGLIGQINANATVKKCSIDGNSVVVGSDSNTAGLIGNAITGDNIQLISLINNAKVENTATSNSRAAGILSQVTSDGKGGNGAIVTLKDCVNNGVIKTNNGYTGGIVSAYQNGKVIFDGCANNKSLTEFSGNTKVDLLAWITSAQSVEVKNYKGAIETSIGMLETEYKRCIVFNGITILVNAPAQDKTFSELYQDKGILSKATMDKLIGFYEYVLNNHSSWNIDRTSYFKIFTAEGSFGGDGWPQALAEYNKTTFENESDYVKKEDFAIVLDRKAIVCS